jgi:Flp pilus assembly pilin Flp
VRLKLVFSRGSAQCVALTRDARGAVLLEYTILIGIVGISSAAALVLLGIAFVDSFSFLREMLLTPFP